MIFNYRFTLVLIPFLMTAHSALSASTDETIEIESAILRCDTDEDDLKHLSPGGDEKAVNWRPRPLTSFNKTVAVGPHDEAKSDLKPDVENELELAMAPTPHCSRQVLITAKVTNGGKIESGDGTIIKISHVFETKTQRLSRLGNPLIVKIETGPLFALYPINYVYSVNAQAREQVINYENTPDYEGCNDMETPTCGFEHDASGPIQASRGFCCPCGKGYEDGSGRQIRGKQECSAGSGGNSTNTNTTGSNPSPTYHASAHCLRWSKYWYAVHELGPPEIFRQVYVHVYQSLEDENGTVAWSQVGKLAKIDSHNQTQVVQDEMDLSVIYRKVSPIGNSSKNTQLLNSTGQLLLIPMPSFKVSVSNESGSSANGTKTNQTSSAGTKDPAPLRGPIENTYLVVPKTLMDLSGKGCDRIGVSHEAFKGQPSPCTKSQGTCLQNQPFNLWAADTDEKGPDKTHYRLKHFGPVHTPAPLKYVKDTLYLVMEHEAGSASYIDIQLSADHLQLAKPGYNVQILSVTADSSFTAGKLIVEIANNEQMAGFFAVHVLRCTEGLPVQKTELEVVGPQRTRIYPLDLHYGGLTLSTKALCSVAVLNQYNEIVAVRKARLAPGDTCICYVGCECACAKASLECIPLSEEHLLSSGLSMADIFYSEKLEQRKPTNETELEELLHYGESHAMYLIPVIVLVLLLLGTCKGLIGRCCCPRIGLLGLGYFHGKPKRLERYHEKQFSRIDVIHDEDGYPLDPFTKLRTVQRLSSREELGLNSVFFLCCPIIFLLNLCRCCCSKRRRRDSNTGVNETKSIFKGSKPRSGYNSAMELKEMDSQYEHQYQPKSILKSSPRSGTKSLQSFRSRQEADYSIRPSASTTSNYQYRQNPYSGQQEYSRRPAESLSPKYGSWHRRPSVLSATASAEENLVPSDPSSSSHSAESSPVPSGHRIDGPRTQMQIYDEVPNAKSARNATYAPSVSNAGNSSYAPNSSNAGNSSYAPNSSNAGNSSYAPNSSNAGNSSYAQNSSNPGNSSYAQNSANATNSSYAPNASKAYATGSQQPSNAPRGNAPPSALKINSAQSPKSTRGTTDNSVTPSAKEINTAAGPKLSWTATAKGISAAPKTNAPNSTTPSTNQITAAPKTNARGTAANIIQAINTTAAVGPKLSWTATAKGISAAPKTNATGTPALSESPSAKEMSDRGTSAFKLGPTTSTKETMTVPSQKVVEDPKPGKSAPPTPPEEPEEFDDTELAYNTIYFDDFK